MIIILKNLKKMLLIPILIKKMKINNSNNKMKMIKNKQIQIKNEKMMKIVMVMIKQQHVQEKKLFIKHKVFNKK